MALFFVNGSFKIRQLFLHQRVKNKQINKVKEF
jgi:hypothetical protein